MPPSSNLVGCCRHVHHYSILSRAKTVFAGLVCLALALSGVESQAESIWSAPGDAQWGDPASWSTAQVPISQDGTQLIFGGNTNYTATNNLGDFTLNRLVLNPTLGTITLGGDASNRIILNRSSLAVQPQLTLSGAGNATIIAPVVYSANTTVTNTGSGTLLFGGAQTFVLGTKNTFTNAGTGVITLLDAVGYSTTGTGTGLVLTFINNNPLLGSFNVGNLGGLGNTTFNIGGSGTVSFSGSTGGDLFSSAVLNVMAGATFDFGGNGEGMNAIMGSGTINLRGGLGVSGSGYYEFSGKLTGSTSTPNLTVDGAGQTLVLSGTSSDFTGVTTVNAGRLIVNANAPNGGTGVTGSLGNATSEVNVGNTTGTANAILLIGKAGVNISRNIRIRSGNTGVARLGGLNDTGTATFSGNVTMGTNSGVAKGFTVQTTAGGTVAFTGNLLRATGATGDMDTLTITGVGTAVLGGANTFTGVTTVSGGRLVLDYTVNNGSKLSQTASLTLGGGSVEVQGSSTAATSQTVNGLVLGNSTGPLGGGGRLAVTTGADRDATLNLGVITRNTGTTIDFLTTNNGTGTARILTSTTNTSAGILGAYATFNRNDWAVVDVNGIAALGAGSYSGSFGSGVHTSLAGNTALAAGGATSHTLRLTSAAAITFAAAANTLTLESGGLLVTSEAGATSIGTTSVRGNLASSTGEIVIHQNSTAGALTINSVVSGATTLTKTGGGTLILTGTNTYTGGTYINGGAVQISAVANLGANNSHVYIDGGTLILTAANLIPGSGATDTANTRQIVIGSEGAILDVRANQSVQGGNIRGSGTLTKIGVGSMTFGTAGNSFNGDLVINEGAIVMNSNQLSSVGLITVNSGGTYEVNDDAGATFNGSNTTLGGTRFIINGDGFQGNGAIRVTDQSSTNTSQAVDPRTTLNREIVLQTTSRLQVENGATPGSYSQLILTGNVTGAGGLVKTGNGGLVLAARDNSYGGATEVRNGHLILSGGNDRLPTGTSVTLGSGSTSGVLKLNGFSQTIAGLTTSGSGMANAVVGGSDTSVSLLEVKVASGSQTYAGKLGGLDVATQAGDNHASNNLSLVKSGAGSLTLSGANTYSGVTRVSEGTLVLGNARALGGAGASFSNSDGGTTVEAGGTLDLNGQENVQEVITLRGFGMGGSGALVNNNTGMVASVGNGIASFRVTSVTPLGWSGSGTVSIAPPTSELGLSPSATAQFGLSTQNFTIANGGTGFGLTATRINLTGGGGSGAVVTPILGVTSASFSVNSGTATYSEAPIVTLQNGAKGVAVLDANGKVIGITITDPGSNFSGTHTATFSGGTILQAGTAPSATTNTTNFTIVGVSVVNPGTGYTSAPTVTIVGGTGASIVANDTGFVLNGLVLAESGSGYETAPTVTVSGGTATVEANLSSIVLAEDSSVGGAGDMILNPVISGGHALTKVGTGTTTLAAANTYSGDTTVSAGTLLATNLTGSATGSGNVTVQSAATLGGSGFIGRAAGTAAAPEMNINITVSPGGTLMVGNSHDKPFFMGGNVATLTLQTGGDGTTSGVISLLGRVQFDIFERDAGENDPSFSNDVLVLHSANQVVLGGVLEVRDLTGTSDLSWAIGDSWKLIDWAGVLPATNYSGGFQSFDLPDLAVGLKWDTSQIYTSGVITVAVVPEPGRMGLMVLAGASVLLRRRRKR